MSILVLIISWVWQINLAPAMPSDLSQTFFHKVQHKKFYPNGDVYFLIGNLPESWAKEEFSKYFAIANWLVENGFRVIINPAAKVQDVQEAVQNNHTSILIWSSHGTKEGELLDAENTPLPHDIFRRHVGRRLKQIVDSSCHGEVTAQVYDHPKVTLLHWKGITDTDDLFHYLMSDQWDLQIEKNLKIKI